VEGIRDISIRAGALFPTRDLFDCVGNQILFTAAKHMKREKRNKLPIKGRRGPCMHAFSLRVAIEISFRKNSAE
jgi:hypothetical protein